MSEQSFDLKVSPGAISLLGAGLQALSNQIGQLSADLNAQIAAQVQAQATPEAALTEGAESSAPIPAVRAPRDAAPAASEGG